MRSLALVRVKSPMQVFNSSFLPTQGRQSLLKLDNYAQLYATYTNLIQQQGDAMRHDMPTMEMAYNQVTAEVVAEQNAFAQNESGSSYILADLNEYARCCHIDPRTFEDRVRISFAASGFVQILMHFVIGKLNKNDMEWVMARATQILSEGLNPTKPTKPIPTFAPAVCKFRHDKAVSLSVTDRDIARWQANPQELVGKCFTTSENIMRRTFLVQDYYVKSSGLSRYEVVFEDTGLEVLSLLDRKAMLTMVKDAKMNVLL